MDSDDFLSQKSQKTSSAEERMMDITQGLGEEHRDKKEQENNEETKEESEAEVIAEFEAEEEKYGHFPTSPQATRRCHSPVFLLLSSPVFLLLPSPVFLLSSPGCSSTLLERRRGR